MEGISLTEDGTYQLEFFDGFSPEGVSPKADVSGLVFQPETFIGQEFDNPSSGEKGD